jgi:hypothetical protein
MNSDRVSIETIFGECNNYLRESDKNRDQLIQFYLVVVGGYLAVIKAANLDQIMIIVLGFGIFCLGVVLTRSVADYRLWHTRYMSTARLLVAFGQNPKLGIRETEKMMRKIVYQELGIQLNSKDGTPLNIKEEISNPFKRFGFYVRWKTTGTEFYRFVASIIISDLPLFISLNFLLDCIPAIYLPVPKRIILIILILLIYFLLFHWFASYLLYKVNRNCPWATWLLDGLDPEWDFVSQRLRRYNKQGQ